MGTTPIKPRVEREWPFNQRRGNTSVQKAEKKEGFPKGPNKWNKKKKELEEVVTSKN